MESEIENQIIYNEIEKQISSDDRSPISAITLIQEDNITSSIDWTPEVETIYSPGGKPRQFIPNCHQDLKPQIGMKFKSLNDGIEFYKKYATAAGFNMRKSTNTKCKKRNVITFQYILCNKEGEKRNKFIQVKDKTNVGGNTKQIRKTLVTRVGCKARIVFRYCKDGEYAVSTFFEEHNHALYTPSSMMFQKQWRKVNMLHKKMIVQNSKNNIGATKTFKQVKELVGGFQNIGASKQDFKNFNRDLKGVIDEIDGQMFIDNFKAKKEICNTFFFEYELDDAGNLNKALWADTTSRRNYALFGDMVSFDTTYSTNRYSAIFGPFTGIDNHKRCVTFASCFISNEDIASFEWVFKSFLKAMGNNEPTCLITDQDPAMMQAVEHVFTKTKHRFCMWHIMKKIPDKLGRKFTTDSDFLKRINTCVWNVEIEKEEFETNWKEILLEFELQDNIWLNKLFDDRKKWIPAYFRDLFMAGLMRTTSRSESENNFFTALTNPYLTLVEFTMRFDSCIEAQRHAQDQSDSDSKPKDTVCKTPLEIEKHASEVYTTTIFYEFQDQVSSACFSCGVESMTTVNDMKICSIIEKSRKRIFQVKYNTKNSDTTCSCKMFLRVGIPCRHMIWIWKEVLLDRIPDKYILHRWTILARMKPVFDIEGNILEQCTHTIDKKRLLNELWTEMNNCVCLVENDDKDVEEFTKKLTEWRKELEVKNANKVQDKRKRKLKEIEMLIGAPIPTEITIKPPKVSKNKGTGVHIPKSCRRLRSKKEEVVEQSHKRPRLCNGCGQYERHDFRTCPLKVKK